MLYSFRLSVHFILKYREWNGIFLFNFIQVCKYDYVYNIILKLNYFVWTEVCWVYPLLTNFRFSDAAVSLNTFLCNSEVLFFWYFSDVLCKCGFFPLLNESQIEQTILSIKWKWFTCFRVFDWWFVYLRNRVLYD